MELEVSTENYYWSSRLIGALTDPNYNGCIQMIDRYREAVAAKGRQIVAEYDRKESDDEKVLMEANEKLCAMAKEWTGKTLNGVLAEASRNMKNGFSLADN